MVNKLFTKSIYTMSQTRIQYLYFFFLLTETVIARSFSQAAELQVIVTAALSNKQIVSGKSSGNDLGKWLPLPQPSRRDWVLPATVFSQSGT